jgi:hypothetical protein
VGDKNSGEVIGVEVIESGLQYLIKDGRQLNFQVTGQTRYPPVVKRGRVCGLPYDIAFKAFRGCRIELESFRLPSYDVHSIFIRSISIGAIFIADVITAGVIIILWL